MSDEGASRELPRFANDEPAVTILHLSDVQFGKHHRFADEDGGFNTLLQRLCDDLDLLKRKNGLAPDLVALTGDLAEWGKEREFAQVAEFGEGLLQHLKLEPDRLLVVPGNHDINRSLCESHFLRCEGNDEVPKPPYWPKWEPFVGLVNRLYRNVERYRFTEIEPWTLFEIPALKVVVAGLNSTIQESHRDADHHGFVGEAQLRWFRDWLAEYEGKSWLRVGLVHHNVVRTASIDDENLKDANDLREHLGKLLHVLLHGHTHQGRVEMLGTSLPVISTGSAAVKRDQRPGPSPDQLGETPNQYQLVRITRTGLWCAAREYTYERKRWIGDTRVSNSGDRWWYSLNRTWPRAETTFPPPPSAPPGRDAAEPDPERGGAMLDHVRDLLDGVIDWCRIDGDRSVANVTRVRHCGPWGDYARVLHRDGGLGILGAYPGELTADVLERWVADVHDSFRGRGQPVSKLIIDASKIDPALRAAAQARGVEVERMIDFQRVLAPFVTNLVPKDRRLDKKIDTRPPLTDLTEDDIVDKCLIIEMSQVPAVKNSSNNQSTLLARRQYVEVLDRFPIDEFVSLLDGAKRLRILQTFIPMDAHMYSFKDELTRSLGAGCEVHVLLCNPWSPVCQIRQKALKGRHATDVRNAIERNLHFFHEVFERLANDARPRLRVKVYSTLPSMSIYEIDNVFICGNYFHGFLAIDSPQIKVTDRESKLGRRLGSELDKVWGQSSEGASVDLSDVDNWLRTGPRM